MRAGKAWIMVKQARPTDRTPKELGFGTQSLTIFIEDIEAHFQRAKSAGVTIVEELHETVYGEQQYAAVDLEGHHWLFSRHARDLSPEEWGLRFRPDCPDATRLGRGREGFGARVVTDNLHEAVSNDIDAECISELPKVRDRRNAC
jgi:hypothetical protein